VSDRGRVIDRATQRWVRATGRPVSFADHPWLVGPVGDVDLIGDTWLSREADRLGGTVGEGRGLLADVDELAGDGFDPSLLAPPVVDFYQETARWRLEVSSRWSAGAWPFGWTLSALFARRLEQLSLPLRDGDTVGGMDSRVLSVVGRDGEHLGVAWLRTLCSTGQVVYSGWYGTARLPGADRPSLRVVFPLGWERDRLPASRGAKRRGPRPPVSDRRLRW
jgi:hypothetical protein